MPKNPTTAQSPKAAALLRQALLAGVSLYAIAVTGEAQATSGCVGNIISTVCTGPITPSGTMTSFSVVSGGVIQNGYSGISNSSIGLSTLSNTGSISATGVGIRNTQSIGVLLNTSIISALTGATGGWGISQLGSTIGTLINESGGRISGGSTGVRLELSRIGTLTNSGSINGFGYNGIFVDAASTIGAVTNQAGGTISGANTGVSVWSGSIGVLTNSGSIGGRNWSGVWIGDHMGSLINTGSGSITGSIFGIAVAHGSIAIGSLGGLQNNGVLRGDMVGIINGGSIGGVTNGGGIAGVLAGIVNLSQTGPLGQGLNAAYSLGLSGSATITALSNSGVIMGGGAGVYNEGSFGTLTNSGALMAMASVGLPISPGMTIAAGVMNLGQLGTLTNLAGGVIAAPGGGFSIFGVYNSGNIAVMSNAGLITGPTGVYVPEAGTIGVLSNSGTILALGGAGVLVNGSASVAAFGVVQTLTNSGTISGGWAGVYYDGASQQLTNRGTIAASTGAGVFVDTGRVGTLTNSGLILGSQQGVLLSANSSGMPNATIGQLSNSGTIWGGGTGISTGGTIGTLSNNGFIGGANIGINNLSSGTVGQLVNLGTIFGAGQVGLRNDGQFDRFTNPGTIAGNSYGIINVGGIGTLTNNGLIVASGANPLTAILSTGNINTLTNSGLIFSSQGTGLNNQTITSYIGVLTNLNGGTIMGASNAINNAGSIGVLTNAGLITSMLNASVALTNSGQIGVLDNSGFISGYTYGIVNSGGIGTLTNSGVIGGISQAGPYNIVGVHDTAIFNSGSIGSLVNSGIISANGSGGINNTTGGYIGQLSNSGTIVSASSVAVYNSGSIGTLTNSGTLVGGVNGIFNNGNIRLINNSGSIVSAASDYAIYNDGVVGTLLNSGLMHGYTGIYNGRSGTIDRIFNAGWIHGQSYAGIDNDGTIGTLTNSGTITSQSLYNPWSGYYGVSNGGTIGVLENTSSGLIYGDRAGIDIFSTGMIQTLTNSGTIMGGTDGIRNIGGIGLLDNSGTVTGSISGIFNAECAAYCVGNYTPGTIGNLINSGVISGGQTGILNMGVMGPLVNSGTITGGLYALNSSGTFATIGPITNSGVINGNVLVGNQDVAILGGSGSSFGTIMGGSVVITDGNLLFGAGNQLLASNITVKGGAGTVTLGGTLQANIPIAISGNLMQNSGSLLILGINGANQGRLNVTGTVNMANAMVRFQPLNGFALNPSGKYTLVDSATPVGTSYAGVQVTAPGYQGYVTTPMVDGHYNLVLNIGSAGGYTAIGRASGATPGGMGSTLDQLAANNNAFQQQVLTHIDDLPEGKRQQDAVRQTAPMQTAPGAVAMNVSAAPTTQVVEQHQIGLLAQNGRAGGGMAAGSGGSQMRMWMQVMGGYSNRSTTATVDGYSSRSGGMMIGMDYNLSPTAVVGIGTSMLQGRTNTGGVTTGSTTSLTNYSVTAYGTWQFRPDSFVFGQAGGGSNSFTQRRRIGFLGATARSQFSGDQMQVKGGLGHDVHLSDSVTLTPMATLQYLRADTQGYGETGAGLANLRVNRSGVDALVHEVGARVSGRLETPLGTMLPEARLSWTHDYIAGPIAATGQLAGAAFFSTTPRLAPDGARLNLAGTLLYSDRLTVRAEYQGDLRSNYQAHTGLVRASLAF